MPFRKRGPADPESDPEAARAELERAQEAVRYWKQQQAEQVELIASMDGLAGLIARLTGSRDATIAEAETKLKHISTKLKTERMALVKAQQVMARHEARAEQARRQQDQRDLELESVAASLRERPQHPAHEVLARLEDELDDVGRQLIAYQQVIAAAGGVIALLGSAHTGTLRAQTSLLPAQRLLHADEAAGHLKQLPERFNRFQQACIDAGIEPLSIRLPSFGFHMLLIDPALTSPGSNLSIEDLRMEVNDQRGMISTIQMEVARNRKAALERQEQLYAERRALLERVAG